MSYKLFAVILMLFIASSCAPKHQVKPEQPEAQPAEELKLPEAALAETPAEEKKVEAPAAEKKPEEQYIMLNFENADIETVIATVGEMLKINYILAPGVTGKITIQSHNKIPLSELFATFQTILEFNGFTAVKDGSFYRIVPIDTAKQQPMAVEAGKSPVATKDSGFITQQVPLEYVKANDVANIVKNLMPRGTDIVVYEPSNMLIITAPPAGILKFLKLLEAIDIPPTDRDAVRTFVYYVENGEAKKLAEILKSIYLKKGATSSAPVKSVSPATPAPATAPRRGTPTPPAPPSPTKPAIGATVQGGLAGELEGDVLIEAYEDINAILIKSTPRGYLTLLETMKKLDIQPKQVLIEVLIAEVTLDDSTKLGIEWLLKGNTVVDGKSYPTIGGYTNSIDTTKAMLTPDLKSFIPVVSSNGWANIIDPNRFNVLLSAAANKDNIKVLASPHILALDNKEAKIEIADEVPVATSITQPLAGAATDTITSTSQVQFKSAGTILTVTPHINEKNQVSMKIVQEQSEIGSTVKIGGQDFQGFKTRKATTTAIIQDGHTLVIGGIITDRVQKTRAGIPFLSSIPILGYLFGTTTDTDSKRELILLVTPHVVSNHDEADELTRDMKSRVKDVNERIEKSEKKFKKRIEEGRLEEQKIEERKIEEEQNKE